MKRLEYCVSMFTCAVAGVMPKMLFAKRGYWILGIICGVAMILATAVYVTDVEAFSQDLLIPCLEGKKVSFNYPQIGDMVSKPLRYLGHGSEAVAFVSDDDQYVMKVFLKYHMFRKKCPRWRKSLHRLTGFHFTRGAKEEILRRYSLGCFFLPEATGVLAVHRYKSLEQLPTCTVIDHQGIRHTINLDDFAFVIQKKAHLISEEEYQMNPAHFDAKFQELFTSIANKGFVSLSVMFKMENFAILDGKVLMIDLGRLEYIPERAYAAEEERLHGRYLKLIGSTSH